jgi:drug/metabolite transporter (DMT)-like permease
MNHNNSVSTANKDHQIIIGFFLALLSGFSYSTEAIAAKLLYDHGLSPLTVLTWRFLLAAFIFILWARQQLPSLQSKHYRLFVFLGLCQAVTVLFLFYAFLYIPAGLAAFLFYLYPTLVTLMETIFLGIRPNPKRLLALFITLIGLIIIAGPSITIGFSWPGLLYALAAAVGNAIFMLLSDRSLQDLPVAVVSAGTTTTATLAFLAASALTHTSLSFPLEGTCIGLMLFLVLVPSVLALSCLLSAITYLGPGRTAIVATTEPFFTTLLGFIILGEHLYVREIIGGILIVLAVLIERS